MPHSGLNRRDVVLGAGAVALLGRSALALDLDRALPAGTREEAILEALPGKQDLIKLSWRPPNYETPLAAFADPITRNDQFFVRYHLAVVPTEAELANWSLSVGGEAAGAEKKFTLDDLKALPHTDIAAVCQCSGNRRGLFSPHVPGVQWGAGAMGNAVWRGVRLRDVLSLVGTKPDAVEVAFRGADGPVLDATPPFRKSIPLDRAMDETVLLAWEMNGEKLPIWNGFPLRLIVPGWTGTYWLKHVARIEVLARPLDNFWMAKAYRVPRGMFPVARPFATQDNDKTSPITEIVVNSLITSPAEGATVPAAGFAVRGLAWDSGSGIAKVDVSVDAGATWAAATLGADLGRFAFRPWSFGVANAAAGPLKLLARASNAAGATQPEKLLFNPAGYHHNVISSVAVTAA
jgi:DMSO/TMAO reductase YedYZ molybdopterin-dependent catalytic subunit